MNDYIHVYEVIRWARAFIGACTSSMASSLSASRSWVAVNAKAISVRRLPSSLVLWTITAGVSYGYIVSTLAGGYPRARVATFTAPYATSTSTWYNLFMVLRDITTTCEKSGGWLRSNQFKGHTQFGKHRSPSWCASRRRLLFFHYNILVTAI